jgi:hypothetical protein
MAIELMLLAVNMNFAAFSLPRRRVRPGVRIFILIVVAAEWRSVWRSRRAVPQPVDDQLEIDSMKG